MREVKLKKTNSDTKNNNLMFLFKKAAPSTHWYKCLICKDCCISPADKVCACWPSGNMCFFKLPHVRLALRKHVNKHNKTQSHLPAKRNSSTGMSAAPVALWRFRKKKKKKLIMNWRHVVEHFPNIFCLSLPRSLLPDFSGCCFILLTQNCLFFPQPCFISSPQ